MRLKYPYKWHERTVILQDGVLFVPEPLDVYPFIDFKFFENDYPIHAEYCSGNGAWIISKALEFPEVNWIAIEQKFDRVCKIWSKVQKHQLKNLLIVCGTGLSATKHYFKSELVSHVYVNFPDPWPKKRHWKHRIIQQPFLVEVNRILKKGGGVTFVTDDHDYSQVMTEELHLSKKFQPQVPSPYVLKELAGYGSSFFEDLWRAKGKEIFYHLWEVCSK